MHSEPDLVDEVAWYGERLEWSDEDVERRNYQIRWNWSTKGRKYALVARAQF